MAHVPREISALLGKTLQGRKCFSIVLLLDRQIYDHVKGEKAIGLLHMRTVCGGLKVGSGEIYRAECLMGEPSVQQRWDKSLMGADKYICLMDEFSMLL